MNIRNVLPPDEVERILYGATLTDLNRPKLPISQGAMEAKKNLEKIKAGFSAYATTMNNHQEKNMSDIKSALEAAIKKTTDAWAEAPQQEKAMEEKKDHRVTTNVSRATFYFIRDNAGLTADEITEALIKQGFKATSVTSLIGQMMRMRMIMADDQKRMFPVVKEYIPIQPVKAKPKAAQPPQERKKVTLVKPSTGEVIKPSKPLPSTPPEWTVESVIGGLNVRQAQAVYMELRKIFGE